MRERIMDKEVLRSVVDRIETVDRFSVLPRASVADRIEKRMRRLPAIQRDKATYALDNEQISRREFLKILGFASGSAVVAGSTVSYLLDEIDEPIGYASHGEGGAEDSDEFEVIEVPAGQTHQDSIGGGESLTNKLYDITANGASVDLSASGDGWAIENIGVRGQWCCHKGNFIGATVPDGGVGVVKGIYVENYSKRGIGVKETPGLSGELRIEEAWIEGFPNNGTYGSSPGATGKNSASRPFGRIVYNNCYYLNNSPANFRTGSPDCEMNNCASIFDGNRPKNYPLTGADALVRGVWNRGFDLTITDSDIKIPSNLKNAGAAILSARDPGTHPQADGAFTYLENTRIEGRLNTGKPKHDGHIEGKSAGQPEDRVPEGVPTSPEEAAAGESTAGGLRSTTDTEGNPC